MHLLATVWSSCCLSECRCKMDRRPHPERASSFSPRCQGGRGDGEGGRRAFSLEMSRECSWVSGHVGSALLCSSSGPAQGSAAHYGWAEALEAALSPTWSHRMVGRHQMPRLQNLSNCRQQGPMTPRAQPCFTPVF